MIENSRFGRGCPQSGTGVPTRDNNRSEVRGADAGGGVRGERPLQRSHILDESKAQAFLVLAAFPANLPDLKTQQIAYKQKSKGG